MAVLSFSLHGGCEMLTTAIRRLLTIDTFLANPSYLLGDVQFRSLDGKLLYPRFGGTSFHRSLLFKSIDHLKMLGLASSVLIGTAPHP
jgi:hypothetical protein